MTTLKQAARKSSHPRNMGMLREVAKRMAETWQKRWPPDTEVSQSLVYDIGFMRLDKLALVLKEELPGKRLIDLGAGNPSSYIAMAHFAASLGVSEYVAVDLYQDYSRAASAMEHFIHPDYPDVRLSAEREDMLLYLARQPDCSSNICINGIDDAILRHRDVSLKRMYVHSLVAEMARVVPENGLVFGINSPCIGKLAEFGFKQALSDLVTMDYELTKHNGVYQKKA